MPANPSMLMDLEDQWGMGSYVSMESVYLIIVECVIKPACHAKDDKLC